MKKAIIIGASGSLAEYVIKALKEQPDAALTFPGKALLLLSP